MNFSQYLIAISFVLLQACSHYNQDRAAVRPAAELGSGEYVVVHFPPGKDRLLETEKEKIRLLKNAIEGRNNVASIEVMAWSDQEYPVEGTVKPSKSERQLADARARVVKEYLKRDLGSKKDVDTHNMAQQPGFFSKVFDTDDYKMKSSLEASAEIGFISENKESKAVILVKYE